MVWAAGIALTRLASQPSATVVGGRLSVIGFALVFLGLALLLVLAAVLTTTAPA